MPVWFWWAPLAALITAFGLWAFRWGWIAATITETDVINTYAQRYLGEAGDTARVSDCVARPGARHRVWITVHCASENGVRHDYSVDRFGRLLDLPGLADAPAVPET